MIGLVAALALGTALFAADLGLTGVAMVGAILCVSVAGALVLWGISRQRLRD